MKIENPPPVLETISPKNRQEWRDWLQENHDKKQFIWIIYFKKNANQPSISYSDAVDEALCFGWIDSKSQSIDAETYRQYFCRRKPKSVWSKVNKAKIVRLMEQGLMTDAGLKSIAIAQENGSWTTIDDAEELRIPEELEQLFQNNPRALSFFETLSRSDKRNILTWLVLAKRPETREKRMTEIVANAEQNLKPKQFR